MVEAAVDERRPPGAKSLVEIWFRATDTLGSDDLRPMLDMLSIEERLRSERFHFAADRRDYVVAHAILRWALARRTGQPPTAWQFWVNGCGKPYVAPGQPEYEVNLSHTKGLVACALTGAGPVGIDVEAIDTTIDTDRIARHFFSVREIAVLSQYEADERPVRFTELWTLKEAYLKALGTGLGKGLAHFSIELEGLEGLRFHPPPGHPRLGWHFSLFAPSEHHRLAIVVSSPEQLDYSMRAWSSESEDRGISSIRYLFAK